MNKLVVGFDSEEWGTIEFSHDGLMLHGDKDILARLIRDMQHDIPDDEFLRTLPVRLTGRLWAREVNDTELKKVTEKFNLNFNPNREPKGSPGGGRFARGSGGPGRAARRRQRRRAGRDTRGSRAGRAQPTVSPITATISGLGLGSLKLADSSIPLRISGMGSRTAFNEAGIDNNDLLAGVNTGLAEVNPEHLEGIKSMSFDTMDNAAGLYDFRTNRVTIDPTRSTLAGGQYEMEYLVKHEVGHNRWMQLTPEQRQRYAELVGHPDPESVRNADDITKKGQVANVFYATQRGKDAVRNNFRVEVDAVSRYGQQNIQESFAESYVTINWVTGEVDSVGLSLGTIEMLEEIAEW